MKSKHGILASKRIIKFVSIGVINTIVGCGLMFVLFNVFGCSYGFSSFMNYAVGATLGYFLNKYITFECKQQSLKEILIYVVNIFVCYKVSYGIGALVVSWGLHSLVNWGWLPSVVLEEMWIGNLSMAFSAGLYVVLNYLGQSLLVFKPTKVNDSDSRVRG